MPARPTSQAGAPTGSSCLRAPAGVAGSFGAKECVYSTASTPPTACPAGFPTGPTTTYTGLADTRGCDPTCPCRGAPTGGACAGTVSFYGNFPDAGCTGAADTYAIGTACQCFGQSQCGANDLVILNNMPGWVRASYTVTPGACAPPGAPASTGAAAPAGPFTVCCM